MRKLEKLRLNKKQIDYIMDHLQQADDELTALKEEIKSQRVTMDVGRDIVAGPLGVGGNRTENTVFSYSLQWIKGPYLGCVNWIEDG